jgi:hypothetical protein
MQIGGAKPGVECAQGLLEFIEIRGRFEFHPTVIGGDGRF